MTNPALADLPFDRPLNLWFPGQIDTFLADNYYAQFKLENDIRANVIVLDVFDRKVERGDRISSWDDQQYRSIKERLPEQQAELRALINASAPYEAEYVRRGRWNRYYLVTNTNGHVHRGLHCNTCFPTTEYAWLPELSDCDEAKMIEEFGEKACTVCFPNAPANPAFHAPGRRDREAIEAREAEKAARQAVKDAKAITDVDGSPLRDHFGGVLKTKVAARNELSQAVQCYGYYGSSHPSNFLNVVWKVGAALEQAGVETGPVIERAAKKALKEGATYDIREVL